MPLPVPRARDTNLTVRSGTPDDAVVLAELFIAARDAAYPAMPRSIHTEQEIRAWFRQLLGSSQGDRRRERRATWLAQQDGDVVAYAILDSEGLDSLYVRPDLAGQGVGSVLLDLAKRLRPDGFGLWVFETNVRARQFYARHGLVETERTDGFGNEEHAPDIRMMWLPQATPAE